jgi:hypothetical protein
MTSASAEDLSFVKSALEDSMKEEERVAIRKWLYPDDLETDSHYKAALNQKAPDTGEWLLKSKEFEDWLLDPRGFMWLYGIGKSSSSLKPPTMLTVVTAGCGKTVLSYAYSIPNPFFQYLHTDRSQSHNHRSLATEVPQRCDSVFLL